MVLICPHCAARSLVDGAQAKKPMAQVACGGCGKTYFVSAAHRDAEPSGGQQAHLALARSRAQASRGLPRRPWARPAAALGATLLLAGLCLWDVGKLEGLQADAAATVQLPGPDARGLELRQVVVTPYAPTGGPEGLLVAGALHQGGGAAAAVVPEVVVQLRHPSLPKATTVRLRACSSCTLERAKSLDVLTAAEVVPSATLAPGSALPFVGLLHLPQLPPGAFAPWQVELGFSSAL